MRIKVKTYFGVFRLASGVTAIPFTDLQFFVNPSPSRGEVRWGCVSREEGRGKREEGG